MGAASPRARRSLLVAALALSLGYFLLLPPPAEATIYPQKSIARVKLGMSASQVKARLGRPALKLRRAFYYQRLIVRFSKGSGGGEVETTRSTQRTRTKVGVGSTERKVRRGIPGVVCGPHEAIMRLCRLGSGAPNTKVTDFVLYNNRVQSVALTMIPDKTPPTNPSNLTVTGTTKTSVSLSWSPSTDDVAVAYALYGNGLRVGKTSTSAATFSGLACGASYTLGLQAYDAAGNHSARVSIPGSTAGCPSTGEIHVSPTGSDANPCTLAAPCLSFNRAYRVAAPGQVVDVSPGTYPGQIIRSDPAKTALGDVVFRPSGEGSVSLTDGLRVYASHIEFRDLLASYWYAQPGARDLTFRNLDVNKLFITGASDISVIGGDVGPLENSDSQIKSGQGQVPTNILLDGVYFHDAIKTDPSAHTECLQFGSGINVILRNSVFSRCSHHDVFIRSWGSINNSPHPLKNFLIENNVFGSTLHGYYSLRLAPTNGWPCEQFVIRNNSALQNIFSDCVAKGVYFFGNIQPRMTSYMCSKFRYTALNYNLYENGIACGKDDSVGDPMYADRASLDLHPRTGSAAIDRGHPLNFSPSDAHGVSRPLGLAADAGAFETE